MSIEVASTRMAEIQTYKQQVFSENSTRFAQILREKTGGERESAAPAATAASGAVSSGIANAMATGMAGSGSSGLLSGMTGSSSLLSGIAGTGSSNNSLNSMLMLSMLSGSGGGMSSMLLPMLLMSGLNGQSGGNACAACGSALNGGTLPEGTGSTGDFSGAEQYMDIVSACSQKYDVPENVILAVMKVESGFKNNRTSSAGAQGLMQLMPGTARSLGVTNVMDPAQNIEGGTKYIRKMLDAFNGDLRLALAAYNTGPGNVRKHGSTFAGQASGVQGYVNKVLGYAGISAA